jgi:uncharacterized protein (DUF302 family)
MIMMQTQVTVIANLKKECKKINMMIKMMIDAKRVAQSTLKIRMDRVVVAVATIPKVARIVQWSLLKQFKQLNLRWKKF